MIHFIDMIHFIIIDNSSPKGFSRQNKCKVMEFRTFLKTLDVVTFICQKSKVELCIFAKCLHFLVVKKSMCPYAKDGFIATKNICSTQTRKNWNFLVTFMAIFVAISVFDVLPDFSKTKSLKEV